MMGKNSIGTLVCASIIYWSLSTAFAHELGLQVYSLRHQFEENGVDDTFKTIKSWNISALEGAGNLYGMSIYEYQQALAENELQIVSVDTNYEEVSSNPLAVVYKANFYGAKFATFYWIPHEGRFSIEHAKKAVDMLNKNGKILKRHGITLQYHPHGYELIPHKQATVLDYMLENVKHAQFQMDVFWIKNGGGDPVDYLKRYPNRWTSLHLKDRAHGTPNNSTGSQDVETNVVLGTGDVGISAVVQEARKQGIKYFFLEDESSRVLNQMPKSIEYLQSLEKQ